MKFNKKTGKNIVEIDELDEDQLSAYEEQVILMKLDDVKKDDRLRDFMRNPKGSFSTYPYYAMIFSGPAAIIFMIAGLYLTWGTPGIDNVLIISSWIFMLPPALTYYRKASYINKVEEYLPNFLRDIAEMSRAGLTLPAAVETVAKGEYGEMTAEIRKMDASLSWGISFEDTLDNFGKRMNTSLITRSVALITQANRAGGRVSFVLEAAARDASEIKTLERERRGNMAVYVVISYMSFFVFIFVILMLATKFVPTMHMASVASTSAPAGGSFIGSFDADNFIRILFHATIIQGYMSGLVAGQMGEGKLSAGLKHSFALTLIAWLSFIVL